MRLIIQLGISTRSVVMDFIGGPAKYRIQQYSFPVYMHFLGITTKIAVINFLEIPKKRIIGLFHSISISICFDPVPIHFLAVISKCAVIDFHRIPTQRVVVDFRGISIEKVGRQYLLHLPPSPPLKSKQKDKYVYRR